jgi:hypothetical protein
MIKRSTDKLPEANHPFARWCSGIAIASWALGVQSFQPPWNQLGAILSPGVGYIVGLSLDVVITRLSEKTSKRKQKRDLLELTKKIDDLFKERKGAIDMGADSDSDIVKLIDSSIEECRRNKIDILLTTQFRRK